MKRSKYWPLLEWVTGILLTINSVIVLLSAGTFFSSSIGAIGSFIGALGIVLGLIFVIGLVRECLTIHRKR